MWTTPKVIWHIWAKFGPKIGVAVPQAPVGTQSRNLLKSSVTAPTNLFVFKASSMWNKFLNPPSNIDFSSPIALVKGRINKMLLESQKVGHTDEWSELNFSANELCL